MASILIVDDTSFVRITQKKFLEKFGHIIVGETGCAQEAIMMYKEHKPDIVTMNIVLQNESNGLDALKQIIELDHNANVIMITGSGYVGTVSKALSLGARGFLVKPIEGKKLSEIIEKILSTSSEQIF